MVIVLPPVGTVPAKLTEPETGARTGAPAGAPMSMPRCWPPAYGSSPRTRGRTTGPATRQAHAAPGVEPPARRQARPRRARAARRPGARRGPEAARRGFSSLLLLVVKVANSRSLAGRKKPCQIRLQCRFVKLVARDPSEA